MSSGLQLLDQLADDIRNGRPVVALPASPDSAPSSGSASASKPSFNQQSKSPSKQSPKPPERGKRKTSNDDSTSKASTKKDRPVSKPKKPHIPSNELVHLLDVTLGAVSQLLGVSFQYCGVNGWLLDQAQMIK
ncbi:hypothetical protein PInf_025558 [Phytophthora infestans]|nr:hypothetical protein PInf_025558 [Phytophthora infestans]